MPGVQALREALQTERIDERAPNVDRYLENAILESEAAGRPLPDAYLHRGRRAIDRFRYRDGIRDLLRARQLDRANQAFADPLGEGVDALRSMLWTQLARAHTELAFLYEQFYITSLNAQITYYRLKLAVRERVADVIVQDEEPYLRFYLGNALALARETDGAVAMLNSVPTDRIHPFYGAWRNAWLRILTNGERQTPAASESIWDEYEQLRRIGDVANNANVPGRELLSSVPNAPDSDGDVRAWMRSRIALSTIIAQPLTEQTISLLRSALGSAPSDESTNPVPTWLGPELVIPVATPVGGVNLIFGDPWRFLVAARAHFALAEHAWNSLKELRELNADERGQQFISHWKRASETERATLRNDLMFRDLADSDALIDAATLLYLGRAPASRTWDSIESLAKAMISGDPAVFSRANDELFALAVLMLEYSVETDDTDKGRQLAGLAASVFNRVRGDNPFLTGSDPRILAFMADASWYAQKTDAAAHTWNVLEQDYPAMRITFDLVRRENSLLLRQGKTITATSVGEMTRWPRYFPLDEKSQLESRRPSSTR